MRFFLKFLFFLLLCSTAFAQSPGHGIKVGLSQIGNPEHEYEMVNNKARERLPFPNGGLTFGFYINQARSDHFWIKHEVLYVNKGYVYKDRLSTGEEKTLKVYHHYIDIYPVNCAFNLKGMQLFIGPVVGLYLGRKAEYLKNNKIEIEREVEYDASNRNLVEGMLSAGIEYESKPGINLGVRVTQSFFAIKHPSSKNYSTGNYNVSFLVGYTFLKKKMKEQDHSDLW